MNTVFQKDFHLYKCCQLKQFDILTELKIQKYELLRLQKDMNNETTCMFKSIIEKGEWIC